MTSFGNTDKTTANDRPEVVITDETNGYYAEVTSEKRLKVESKIDVNTAGTVPSIGNDLRYRLMSASTGGVARDTSITDAAYVNVYNESGSGLFFGMLLTLEEGEKNWWVKVLVDSETLIEIRTDELDDPTYYNFDNATHECNCMGLEIHNKTTYVQPPFPIRYSSSVVVQAKRVSGQAAKKFKAGMVLISGLS